VNQHPHTDKSFIDSGNVDILFLKERDIGKPLLFSDTKYQSWSLKRLHSR